jgi:hypothetical protein
MAIERVGKFKEIYLVYSPKLYVEVCISPVKAVPLCQVLTTYRDAVGHVRLNLPYRGRKKHKTPLSAYYTQPCVCLRMANVTIALDILIQHF